VCVQFGFSVRLGYTFLFHLASDLARLVSSRTRALFGSPSASSLLSLLPTLRRRFRPIRAKTRSCASRSSFNLTSSPFLCIVLSPHFTSSPLILSLVRFLSSFSSFLLPLSCFVLGLRLAFVRSRFDSSFDSSWIGGITCDFRDGNLVSQRGFTSFFFSGLMPQNELVSFFALALRNCVFYSSLFGSVFVAFVAHLLAFLLELSGFVGFLFRVWL